MTAQISDAEKVYLLHGIEEDLRVSGRTRQEFRPVQITCDVDLGKVGSAKVTFGGTTVLASVEASLNKADTELSGQAQSCPALEGSMELRVHCAASSTLGSDREMTHYQLKIEHFLSQQMGYLEKQQLNVVKDCCAWDLHINVNVLQFNGNACDVASLAVLAALSTSKLPRLSVIPGDGNEYDIKLADPLETVSLDTASVPIFATVYKTGTSEIVDADILEEEISFSRLVVAIGRNGQIFSIDKDGPGSLTVDSIDSMIRQAKRSGVELFSTFDEEIAKFIQNNSVAAVACPVTGDVPGAGEAMAVDIEMSDDTYQAERNLLESAID